MARAQATRTVRMIRNGKDAPVILMSPETLVLDLDAPGYAMSGRIDIDVWADGVQASCAEGENAPWPIYQAAVNPPEGAPFTAQMHFDNSVNQGRVWADIIVDEGASMDSSTRVNVVLALMRRESGELEYFERTVTVELKHMKGGEGDPGENAVTYRLHVDTSTIKAIAASNGRESYSPSEIHTGVIRTEGSSSRRLDDMDLQDLDFNFQGRLDENDEWTPLHAGETLALGTDAMKGHDTIWLRLVGGDGTVIDSATVNKVSDGIDGKTGMRGAALRGPMWWEEIDDGFQFMAGGDGEDFIDVVVSRGAVDDSGSPTAYYRCRRSHTKAQLRDSGATLPNQTLQSGEKVWDSFAKLKLVASDIVLSRKIRADEIDGTHLKVKDGDVDGDLSVGMLRHKRNPGDAWTVTSAFWAYSAMHKVPCADGLVPMPKGYLTFPPVPPGELMETTVVHFPDEIYYKAVDKTGYLRCIGAGFDTESFESDGCGYLDQWYEENGRSMPEVMFCVQTGQDTSGVKAVASRASGTVMPENPDKPVPGGDDYQVVMNDWYNPDSWSEIIQIRGLWKFYGVGWKEIDPFADKEVERTVWIAVGIQTA